MKIIIIIAAIVALYIVLCAFSRPVGAVLKIMIKGAVGCGVIYLMNTLLAPWGFFIGINPVTYAVCALLGISGFCTLIGIQLVI